MQIIYFIVFVFFTIVKIGWASHEPFDIIEFPSGNLTLKGELFLPKGKGPFPVILYNHGSAPKMLNSQASAAIAPMFTAKGWAFFMPYRRGQGLSEDQGAYIMHQIQTAKWSLFEDASEVMVYLLKTDHLNDQIAAFHWLEQQDFVQKDSIATMGNSFGGIEVLLGMAEDLYCAGIVASGGTQSWKQSLELQALMKEAAEKIKKPVFFFQAENDYDLSPSQVLSRQMDQAGKIQQFKVYPPFGKSAKEGHSFPYKGVSIWFEDIYFYLNQYCP